MNIVLIEDESLALQKIKRLLKSISDNFNILTEIKSVEEGFLFLKENTFDEADLIFSDIQLSDGLSFQIFEKHPTITPIIFTTAYDEYALKAFRVSGIDYLLKPFKKEDLETALEKYKQFKNKLSDQQSNIHQLLEQFYPKTGDFPNFISYLKDKIIPINSENVSCFYIENQITYALLNNQKSPLNDTLDKIEVKLPKRYFFRANRQHIIKRESIKSIENYFNGKLLVKLDTTQILQIFISKEKGASFKKWLEL